MKVNNPTLGGGCISKHRKYIKKISPHWSSPPKKILPPYIKRGGYPCDGWGGGWKGNWNRLSHAPKFFIFGFGFGFYFKMRFRLEGCDLKLF